MTRHDCPTYAAFDQTGHRPAGPGCRATAACTRRRSRPSPASSAPPEKPGRATWRTWAAPCLHPDLGAKDDHQSAQVGDQYATRHNPFVYFRASPPARTARRNDVELQPAGR